MSTGIASHLISAIRDCEKRFSDTRLERIAKEREINKFYRGGAADWRKLDTPERIANRMRGLGMAAEAAVLDQTDGTSFSPLEAIIAKSELTGIAFFELGLIASRAVARVEIRSSAGQRLGFGTGFLISPQLLLTNNHVLPDAQTAGASVAQFNYLAGCSGKEYDPLVSPFHPTKFFITDKSRDFTVVAVDEAAARRGFLPLIRGSGKAMTGETVNILQHPGGERLQVVVRDNTVLNVPASGFFMQYRADTRPGSSGAPVLNDQWELAALHHAGVPKRDTQGRILLVDGSIWNQSDADVHHIAWEANEGVRISAIVQHVDQTDLDSAKKALWEECFKARSPMDIWPFFDTSAREARDPDSQPSEPEGMKREADGSVSWYFRLNFGPVGGPSQLRLSPVPPKEPTAANRVDRGVADTRTKPASSSDTTKTAREIFENFKWKEDYYDAKTDRQDAKAYYDGFDWSLSSKRSHRALSKLLTDTHTEQPTYNKARLMYLYPAVDLHEDNSLRHIYSGKAFDPVEAIEDELARAVDFARAREGFVAAQALETLLERDDVWDALEEAGKAPFNCEHVVPQSWFTKQEPMRGDLHHLFTCESRCNSFRGNTPYWQFSPETEAVMQQCGRRQEDKFEPKHGKGAIARATLYFLVRYPGEIGDEEGELTRERLNVLLDWHRNSAVSLYEKHRNRVIFKIQGNRNPFIDHPDKATESLLEAGFGEA